MRVVELIRIEASFQESTKYLIYNLMLVHLGILENERLTCDDACIVSTFWIIFILLDEFLPVFGISNHEMNRLLRYLDLVLLQVHQGEEVHKVIDGEIVASSCHFDH